MEMEELFGDMDMSSVFVIQGPDRLRTLALGALARYVLGLMMVLVSHTKGVKLADVKQTCKRLQEIFQATVPASLANEVTQELLESVDSTLRTFRMSAYRRKLERVAPVVLRAVLHPSVTRIGFYKDKHHLDIHERFNTYVPTMVVTSLQSVRDLTELRLPVLPTLHTHSLSTDISLTKNLQVFSSSLCNDRLLGALSITCKGLKVLDVSHSPITDIGVGFINLFQHLEELDVTYTQLSMESVRMIIKGFVQVEFSQLFTSLGCCGCSSDAKVSYSAGYPAHQSFSLKSFGCGPKRFSSTSDFEYAALSLLFDNFPHLTSLSLINFHDPGMDEFKRMKSLTRLTARVNNPFHNLTTLLQSMGSQLVFLDVGEVFATDLKAIVESCHSLKCLHISLHQPTDDNPLNPEDIPTMFAFRKNKSVHCLSFESHWMSVLTEHIITKFKNVNQLYILYGDKCMTVQLFHSLFLRNIMKNLKKFMVIWDTDCTKGTEVRFNDSRAVLHSVRTSEPCVRKSLQHIHLQ